MNKKGISPLLATVLLIILVIVLAVTVMTLGKGLYPDSDFVETFIDRTNTFNQEKHVCEEWDVKEYLQEYQCGERGIEFIDKNKGIYRIISWSSCKDEKGNCMDDCGGGIGYNRNLANCEEWRDKTHCELNPTDSEKCICEMYEKIRVNLNKESIRIRDCIDTPSINFGTKEGFCLQKVCIKAREKTECELGNQDYILDGGCNGEVFKSSNGLVLECSTGWEDYCREKTEEELKTIGSFSTIYRDNFINLTKQKKEYNYGVDYWENCEQVRCDCADQGCLVYCMICDETTEEKEGGFEISIWFNKTKEVNKSQYYIMALFVDLTIKEQNKEMGDRKNKK